MDIIIEILHCRCIDKNGSHAITSLPAVGVGLVLRQRPCNQLLSLNTCNRQNWHALAVLPPVTATKTDKVKRQNKMGILYQFMFGKLVYFAPNTIRFGQIKM